MCKATLQLVIVTWYDALEVPGWRSVGQAKLDTPGIFESVGYLVENTKEFITISISKNTNNLAKDSESCPIGATLTVSRGAIISIKFIPPETSVSVNAGALTLANGSLQASAWPSLFPGGKDECS